MGVLDIRRKVENSLSFVDIIIMYFMLRASGTNMKKKLGNAIRIFGPVWFSNITDTVKFKYQ